MKASWSPVDEELGVLALAGPTALGAGSDHYKRLPAETHHGPVSP